MATACIQWGPDIFWGSKGTFCPLPRMKVPDLQWDYLSLHQLFCLHRWEKPHVRLCNTIQGIWSGRGCLHWSHFSPGPVPPLFCPPSAYHLPQTASSHLENSHHHLVVPLTDDALASSWHWSLLPIFTLIECHKHALRYICNTQCWRYAYIQHWGG